MQKFHPILYSTPMVQAILEDTKTKTRRKVKPQPVLKENGRIDWALKGESSINNELSDLNDSFFGMIHLCPYGSKGDVLWVRETYFPCVGTEPQIYAYKADWAKYRNEKKATWKPSIFMPKAACRIFLEITDVKVERLQDISEEDAISEGVESCYPSQLCGLAYKDYLDYPDDEFEWFSRAVYSFQSLWQSINGPESWEANPFVWVISFKKITKPENFK